MQECTWLAGWLAIGWMGRCKLVLTIGQKQMRPTKMVVCARSPHRHAHGELGVWSGCKVPFPILGPLCASTDFSPRPHPTPSHPLPPVCPAGEDLSSSKNLSGSSSGNDLTCPPPSATATSAAAISAAATNGAVTATADGATDGTAAVTGPQADPEEGGLKGVAPKGSALPFTPIRMTFQDLQYSVPLPAVSALYLSANLGDGGW